MGRRFGLLPSEIESPMISKKIIKAIFIFCIFSYYFFESCSSSRENELDQSNVFVDTITISVDNQKITEIPWDQLIEDIKVIFLKTVPASLINSVHQSSLFDKKIYIFDRRADRLLVFDRSGEYIGDVGKKGRGPGEFRSLRYFGIDRITQHVFILNYRNILEFDSTLSFIKDNKIDVGNNLYIHPLYFLRISDTLSYIWCDGFEKINLLNPDQKKYHLHKLLNGKINNSKIEILSLNFGKNRFVQSKNVYVMPPEYEYNVKRVNENGIYGGYYIDFGDKAIPKSAINEVYNSSILVENDKMRSCKSISNFLETNSQIFFNFRYGIIEYNVIKNINSGIILVSSFPPKLYRSIPFKIIGYDNITGSLVAIVEPFSLKQFQQDFINSVAVDRFNILKQLSNLDENQNPVILLLKLKD